MESLNGKQVKYTLQVLNINKNHVSYPFYVDEVEVPSLFIEVNIKLNVLERVLKSSNGLPYGSYSK